MSPKSSNNDIIKKIKQALAVFERQTGCVPTIGQMAEKLGINAREIRKVILEFLGDEKLEGTSAFQASLLEILIGKHRTSGKVKLSAAARKQIQDAAESKDRSAVPEQLTKDVPGKAVQSYRTLRELKTGQIVSGEIVRITESGAFIDLGGHEDFLPIAKVVREKIKVGQGVTIKILKVNRKEGRNRLTLQLILPGHKKNTEDKLQDE